MIWPFGKKTPEKPVAQKQLPLMEFTSSQTFFEMQCQLGVTKIELGTGLVAVVVDAVKEFGVPVAVKMEDDGTQLAMVKIVSPKGGFIVPAKTAGTGDPLKVDDLVIWVPVHFDRKLSGRVAGENWGWIGVIAARIAPSIDPNLGGGFKILNAYGSRALKPAR